jgi:hypothetical protein
MSALPKELTRAAWGLVCFKTGYFVALAAALLLWGDLGEFIRLPQRWAPKGGPGFASHFSGWDAGYYLSLSEHGYTAGDSACAFNPLWPLLVRWFSPLAGGSPMVAGLVLANILSAAGCLLFFSLAGNRFGAPAAKLALLFLLAFPGSLFFQFVYSEPLFFFLVTSLWWGLERRRYGVAAAAAFLLPLARSVGVFALLPLAWHVLKPAVQWLRHKTGLAPPTPAAEGRAARSAGGTPPLGGPACATAGAEDRAANEGGPVRSETFLPSLPCDRAANESGPAPPCPPERRLQAAALRPLASFPLAALAGRAWLLAAPLAGWSAYLALMAWWTGSPFEGLQAQKHWGVHSAWNLINLPKFLLGLLGPTAWHAFTGSLLDRCVFVLVLCLLPAIWRLGKDMAAWTVMLAWVPAMSGTFTSFIRFASCAFPLFIALGVLLSRPERRAARYSLLAIFAILQAVLVWRYVNCRWAG